MSLSQGQPARSGLFLFIMMMLPFTLSAAEPFELKTAEVVSRTVSRERVLDGLIEAVKQATVSAQTHGRVIRVNYDVDDFVEKGAILLQFRDTEQRAQYDAAQANYKEAESDYRRIKDLYAKKLVSKSALDKAKARLEAGRAKRDQARENLENTRVRAPYSGIVVKRHIEVGEVANVGQKLFTGISLESLRVTVNVPEDMINIIRKKKQARVILERPVALNIKADSLTISPFADPDSHTFVVRVNLPKGDFHVYPGMFAKVAFAIDEQPKLVVPRAALVHRSEVQAVYTLDEAGRLHFRQVRVGRHLPDGKVIILAGLGEGEKIALDPIQAVARLKAQQPEDAE